VVSGRWFGQLRHRHGKSDPTDALAAARAALSGQATGTPKLRNGPMEQMRVLVKTMYPTTIRRLAACASVSPG